MKAVLALMLYAQIGIAENTAQVQEYLSTVGLSGDYSWCAAFVNYNLESIGLKGTGSPLARSYLNYGTPVDNPEKYDLVIFKRGNSTWQGHVAFYIDETENGVLVLGGNQSDSVNIQEYSKDRILGFRRISFD